jgi:hypothetical protein
MTFQPDDKEIDLGASQLPNLCSFSDEISLDISEKELYF